MTIHVFALCKNDYFIRSIEFYLNRNNIILTGVGTRHDRALDDFAACTPAPDVILLDAHWQPFQTSGPTLTRQFLQRTNAKVILVTNYFEKTIYKNLRQYGAHGYFFRDAPGADTIIRCIQNVYLGQHTFLAA